MLDSERLYWSPAIFSTKQSEYMKLIEKEFKIKHHKGHRGLYLLETFRGKSKKVRLPEDSQLQITTNNEHYVHRFKLYVGDLSVCTDSYDEIITHLRRIKEKGH